MHLLLVLAGVRLTVSVGGLLEDAAKTKKSARLVLTNASALQQNIFHSHFECLRDTLPDYHTIAPIPAPGRDLTAGECREVFSAYKHIFKSSPKDTRKGRPCLDKLFSNLPPCKKQFEYTEYVTGAQPQTRQIDLKPNELITYQKNYGVTQYFYQRRIPKLDGPEDIVTFMVVEGTLGRNTEKFVKFLIKHENVLFAIRFFAAVVIITLFVFAPYSLPFTLKLHGVLHHYHAYMLFLYRMKRFSEMQTINNRSKPLDTSFNPTNIRDAFQNVFPEATLPVSQSNDNCEYLRLSYIWLGGACLTNPNLCTDKIANSLAEQIPLEAEIPCAKQLNVVSDNISHTIQLLPSNLITVGGSNAVANALRLDNRFDLNDSGKNLHTYYSGKNLIFVEHKLRAGEPSFLSGPLTQVATLLDQQDSAIDQGAVPATPVQNSYPQKPVQNYYVPVQAAPVQPVRSSKKATKTEEEESKTNWTLIVAVVALVLAFGGLLFFIKRPQ